MVDNIELTHAELELIRVKREQEALAKKEAEAKQAIQLEKDIKEREAQIAVIQKEDQEQIKAAKIYQAELGEMYTVKIETWNEVKQIMGDYIDRENGFDRHILWSKTFERHNAIIYRVDSTYKILVKEHIVYSSKWSSRGTSKGYKMEIHGPGLDSIFRKYSRASKVNEIIKEAIDQLDARKKAEEAKKNALQTTVDKFKAEYPDAEVTTDKGWERGYGRNTWEGTHYDMVRVKFVNSCSIAYRVYGDGSLSRVSFNLPNAKDEATFMKNLSQMKF